jgi:hypothetical protein
MLTHGDIWVCLACIALEVQADEMSSYTTAAAAVFSAGSCWDLSSWGILNLSFQPVLESDVQLDIFNSSAVSSCRLILLCHILQRNNTSIYLFRMLMEKDYTRGRFSSSSWRENLCRNHRWCNYLCFLNVSYNMWTTKWNPGKLYL